MKLMHGALFVVLGAVALTGCETFQEYARFPGGDSDVPDEVPTEVADSTDHEQALRSIVRTHIESANNSAEIDRDRLVHKRPFYYREYVEYPGGASAYDIEIIEQEQRTAPYLANVEIDKIRFSTRLHRERDDARTDDSFLRDTGTETLTYEYRHGRWKRIGSLFVAQKTEERVDGQWVAVREEPDRMIGEEGPDGFLGRTWERVRNIF